jgi:hypothetical protein
LIDWWITFAPKNEPLSTIFKALKVSERKASGKYYALVQPRDRVQPENALFVTGCLEPF